MPHVADQCSRAPGMESEVTALDREPAQRLLERHLALSYPMVVSLGGVTISVDEGVFCPTLTNTSPFLLEHVPFLGPGGRVADLFSGSGLFAVVAAVRGASVVADVRRCSRS